MQSRVAQFETPGGIGELRKKGIDLCYKGFLDEALKSFQRALYLSKSPETNAEIYCDMGVTYRHMNRLEMADDIFTFILENVHPVRVGVITHIERAIIHLRKLDHQAALEEISRANVEAAADDPILLTHLFSTYGRVYCTMYDFQSALAKYEKALSIIQPHEGASAIPIILNNIGDCHVQLGDFERGVDYTTRALTIARERKNNRCISECLASLMEVAILRKQFDEAKRYGKKALSIARSFKFSDVVSEVEYRLAQLYREEGNEKISDFFFNRVLESHRNLNSEVLTLLSKTG